MVVVVVLLLLLMVSLMGVVSEGGEVIDQNKGATAVRAKAAKQMRKEWISPFLYRQGRRYSDSAIWMGKNW